MARRRRNLFEGLVTNENSVTELLANLMMYEGVRKVLEGLLEKELGTTVRFSHDDIETQAGGGGEGCPDMVIDTGQSRIIVEIKVRDAQLTCNQPEGYLKGLAEAEAKLRALVCLVPRFYQHEEELERRCDAWRRSKGSTDVPKFRVLHWDQMVEGIASLPETDTAIRDFVRLARSWFAFRPITFGRSEIEMLRNPEFTPLLGKLFSVIGLVGKRLESRLAGGDLLIKENVDAYNYGFDVKAGEEDVLYFGIVYDTLMQRPPPSSPILVGVERGYSSRGRFEELFGGKCRREDLEDLWTYAPLETSLLEGSTEDDAAESIATYLEYEVVPYLVRGRMPTT